MKKDDIISEGIEVKPDSQLNTQTEDTASADDDMGLIDEMLRNLGESAEPDEEDEEVKLRKPSKIGAFFLRIILGKDYERAMANTEQPPSAAAKEKVKRTVKGAVGGKQTKHGAMSAVLIAIFLVVVVLLNVLSIALVNRFPQLSVDMTAGGIYTLSDATIELLEGLDEPVEINILCSESQCRTADTSIDPYSQIPVAHELIRRYMTYSDYISIEYVDLSRTPGYLEQFPEYRDLLGQYSIVVSSGKRTRVTSFYEMLPSLTAAYITDEDSIDTSSAYTETYMTSLIKTVTLDKVPVVAYLDGLDGDQGISYLLSILEINGYEIRSVDIRSDEIPADADAAILGVPSRDITLDQATKIDDWLENGGDLGKTLTVFASPIMPDTPILDELLEDWGIRITSDVAYEGSTSQVLPAQAADCFYVQYYESDYITDLNDRGIVSAVSMCNVLERLYDVRGDFIVNPVLSTSASGFACASDEEFDQSDYTLGDMAYRYVMLNSTQYRQNAEGEEVRSDVIALPASLYDSGFLDSSGYGNAQLLLTMFNERAGLGDEVLDIEVKTIDATDFSIQSDTIRVLTFIFSGIVPLVVLLCGLVVFVRRRYL